MSLQMPITNTVNPNGGVTCATWSMNDRYDILSATGLPFAFYANQLYSFIEVFNRTQWASAPSTPIVKSSFWTATDPVGLAYSTENVSGSTTQSNITFASGGIYMLNSWQLNANPLLTGTTITAATPAVATVANNFTNGDVVMFSSVVGMAQISGLLFNITNVSPTGFTIPNLPAATFAGGATSFKVQKINPITLAVFPASATFVAMSVLNSSTAVLQLSSPTNLFVGAVGRLLVPPVYGTSMQIANFNNNLFKIIATGATLNGSTNTITIQAVTVSALINLSAFGTLTFPTSANADGNFPQFVPYGQAGPGFSPPSLVTAYQNSTAFLGGYILGLGVNVCGSLGDNLCIKCYTENSIAVNPQLIPLVT